MKSTFMTASIGAIALTAFTFMMTQTPATPVTIPTAPDAGCSALDGQLMWNTKAIGKDAYFELTDLLKEKACQSFIPWEREASKFETFGEGVSSMTSEWKPAKFVAFPKHEMHSRL